MLLGVLALALAVWPTLTTAATLDDADSRITYNAGGVIWLHETNQAFQPWFDQSLSYSNSPNAWYTFNITCTGFSIFVGKKGDRGRFLVMVDNQFAGGGDAFARGITNETASESLFSISGLVAAQHMVSVYNSKVTDSRLDQPAFLALDYIQFEEATATTTLLVSDSNVYPTNTATTATVSDGVLVIHDGGGNSDRTAIIAGVTASIGSILLVAAIAGIYFLFRRRRQRREARFLQRRDSIDEDLPPMSAYSVTSPFHTSGAPSSPSDVPTSSSLERQSFLPANSQRYSIQHSLSPGSPSEEGSAFQETDAVPGLLPPAYDHRASASLTSPPLSAPSSSDANSTLSSISPPQPAVAPKGTV